MYRKFTFDFWSPRRLERRLGDVGEHGLERGQHLGVGLGAGHAGGLLLRHLGRYWLLLLLALTDACAAGRTSQKLRAARGTVVGSVGARVKLCGSPGSTKRQDLVVGC